MKNLSDKKQTSLNLITSLFAFIINAGINFKLTPYIITQLGTEAYGFIGLANDIVSYASILTMALNAMSSRFISVEYHRGNRKKAQIYINSVLIANLMISGVIAFAAVFVIWKLEYLINIPEYLMWDVKLTFSIVFINYILSICISVLNCAAFVKNKMDQVYIRNMFSYILKLIITILLITIFNIKIYFVSLTMLICTVYLGAVNYIIMKKLMPEIKFNVRGFHFSAVKEILSSGIWMSLLSLSNLMLSGLNSLMTNRFISTVANGYLSAAKTVPGYIGQLGQQLGQIFAPQFTILYSQRKMETLIHKANNSIKIMTSIMTVPIAGFIAYGTEFYTLWLSNYSSDEISLIQTLSVISVIPYLFTAYSYPLVQINTALNKVKTPVIVTFLIGLANILIVVPFGLTNKLTLILLTVFSCTLMSIRLIIFQPIYAAKILKIKISTFYKVIMKSYCIFMLTLVFFFFFKKLFVMESWIQFLFSVAISGILGYIIVFLSLFNRQEHAHLILTLKKKVLNR